MNNNNSQQNFFMGALLGSLAGATAMLLFTPLSGERIRTKLMRGIMPESISPNHKRSSRASGSRSSRNSSNRNSSPSAMKSNAKIKTKSPRNKRANAQHVEHKATAE